MSAATFLAGDAHTIADGATFPWLRNADRRGISLDDYPAVKRWHDAIAARPAVQPASRCCPRTGPVVL